MDFLSWATPHSIFHIPNHLCPYIPSAILWDKESESYTQTPRPDQSQLSPGNHCGPHLVHALNVQRNPVGPAGCQLHNKSCISTIQQEYPTVYQLLLRRKSYGERNYVYVCACVRVHMDKGLQAHQYISSNWHSLNVVVALKVYSLL